LKEAAGQRACLQGTEGIHFGTGHHQLGRLAQLLLGDHIWRADLMAFDNYSSFATATRYPRPGGGMPPTPSRQVLDAALTDVSLLAGEIEDWCREKLADSSRPERRQRASEPALTSRAKPGEASC
jgi:hypothetical protein